MAHSKSEIKKAKNLLSKYAPTGEQLAFINSKEVNLLKRKGGSGKMTKAGIRSYTEDEEDTGDVSNAGSSSSSSGGGSSNDSDDDAKALSYAVQSKPQRSMLSRVGGAIATTLATIATGGIFGIGKLAATGIVQGAKFAKGYTNVGNTLVSNARLNDPKGLYAEGLTTGPRKNINMGGGDSGNNNPAQNVGGRIVKLSPTTAEISQSSATDVTYDSRKTKAKGRSMTILTSSRGLTGNTGAVLGTKSLLGAA